MRPAVDLSVIIVSYNTRDLVLNCLASVYDAAGDLRLEVFVVDNASEDKSVEAVAGAYPEVSLITSKRNLGFSKANNLALRVARGRYVLLLNPDTVVDRACLAKMAEFMDGCPDVGMATCKLVLPNGDLDLACRRKFPTLWDGFCRASGLSGLFPKSKIFAGYNLTFLDENETADVDAVNGAFMFCRRFAIEQVGFLDEEYFMYIEDLDWCYRFRQAGWRIVYYPGAVTIHAKGQSGKQKSSAMIRELFKSTRIFYRKHYLGEMGRGGRALVLVGLGLWEFVTLARNALRTEKRTRP